MALLVGVDGVDWRHLSHAYGPATDVPDLLRALVWPDRASAKIKKAAKRTPIREHVMDTLWSNVFHQGTVWQVTPHVIPFLVEILTDGPRDVVLHEFLLVYLHHLAFGYPQDTFPELVDPATYFATADQAPEDADDPCDNVLMCRYARECYRGVEAALPTVARFAFDDDKDVAFAAISVLGSFRADAAVAALRRVVAEQEGRRFAVALVALAQLDPPAVQARAAALLDDADRYTAVHAAAALTLAATADVPTRAVEVLTSPLDELTEEESPMTDTVGKLVSACLARLPERDIERAVDAIGCTLASAQVTTNLAASGSLLRLVFGVDGQAPRAAGTLTEVQRKALEYILDHGAFEWDGRQFGNYSLMLKDWGLADTRDGLRAWLAS